MHSVINISNSNLKGPGTCKVDKLERVIFPVGIFFSHKIVKIVKNDPNLGIPFSLFTKYREEWHCLDKNHISERFYEKKSLPQRTVLL